MERTPSVDEANTTTNITEETTRRLPITRANMPSRGESKKDLPLSQCQRRWLQGRQQSTIPTVLPQGVCRTVYYVDQGGIRRHFTPGLPPRKTIKDGPNWNTPTDATTTMPDADISDDEEVGIPEALN